MDRQTSAKERNGFRRPLIAIMLAVAGIVGCGGNTGPVAASPVRDPVMADLPKPSGFTLVDDRSVYWQSGLHRVGKCEYLGKTDRDAIKRFYEEYMPSAGFQLREMSLDKGAYSMRFESDKEICMIRVSPFGQGRTAVVVEVGPVPEGKTESPDGPPAKRPRDSQAPPPRASRTG